MTAAHTVAAVAVPWPAWGWAAGRRSTRALGTWPASTATGASPRRRRRGPRAPAVGTSARSPPPRPRARGGRRRAPGRGRRAARPLSDYLRDNRRARPRTSAHLPDHVGAGQAPDRRCSSDHRACLTRKRPRVHVGASWARPTMGVPRQQAHWGARGESRTGVSRGWTAGSPHAWHTIGVPGSRRRTQHTRPTLYPRNRRELTGADVRG